MRTLRTLFVTATIAAAACLGTACGGDDSTNQDHPDSGGNPDATPTTDSSAEGGPQNDGGNDDGNPNEGGMNGCDFAAFVIDLIDNHTNGTDKPVAVPAADCKDGMKQSDFAKYFK
jgi:hypothetical protein